jgi:ubiquinone/menaquinone biosynthesis C-methylase UbiE
VSTPLAGGFDRCAARYDELRPLDAGWWELFERLVEFGDLSGRRLLEVGAGTGAFAQALEERAGARVWAIDASEAMVEQARSRGVNARVGRAERLPFKAGWFERVVMRMVVHLLERPRALEEAARVLGPGGTLVIASEDPARFEEVWFARYFPSVPAIDAARFPGAQELAAELAGAGLPEVRVERLAQERMISRSRALDLIESKAYSTFELLDQTEYEHGLARARLELPAELRYRFDWLLAAASR